MFARPKTLQRDGVVKMVGQDKEARVHIIQDVGHVRGDAEPVHMFGDSCCAGLIDIDGCDEFESIGKDIETTKMGTGHAATSYESKSGPGHEDSDVLLFWV
jgi:hypothetical protein|tara:strand:- start:543 stop:845 length:303 start_codon:yes stop_codon:yes gene_type:complete